MATGLAADESGARHPRRRRRLWLLSILLLVIASVAVTVWWVQGSDSRATAVHAALIGQRAPAFDVADLDGGRLQLADFSNSIVVLNFWASWCVPCRAEAPVLRAASRRWRARGVTVVGIAINDTPSEARAFRREFRLGYRQGINPSGDIASRYGFTGIPDTYVIDRHGIVRAVLLGQLRESMLDDALQAVVEGRSVARQPGRPLQPAR